MAFKRMADGVWEHVKRQHRSSLKHKRRKAAKSRRRWFALRHVCFCGNRKSNL